MTTTTVYLVLERLVYLGIWLCFFGFVLYPPIDLYLAYDVHAAGLFVVLATIALICSIITTALLLVWIGQSQLDASTIEQERRYR